MLLDGIKRRCEANGITIAELERKAGIGNGIIRRWDEMNPRLDNLKAVAGALGVTVDELLQEGDDAEREG